MAPLASNTSERRAVFAATSATTPNPETDEELVTRWLEALERGLASADRSALEALFAEDASWRDLFAFTWNLTPSVGRHAVVDRLLEEQPRVQASGFRIARECRVLTAASARTSR